MATRKTRWFKSTSFGDGDRSLKQQLTGIDPAIFADKTVLDIGCAEGLITKWVLQQGARSAHGMEIVPEHVDIARRLCSGLPATFEVGDLNVWESKITYDIVLALAVIHKCNDPSAVCERIAGYAKELIIVRNPPVHATSIIDWRSGFKPHDLKKILEGKGWRLDKIVDGPNKEPTSYWVK